MGILAWLIVGLIAGFLAKSVVPGEGPGGRRHPSDAELSIAFVGAVVLLLILRAVTARRAV